MGKSTNGQINKSTNEQMSKYMEVFVCTTVMLCGNSLRISDSANERISESGWFICCFAHLLCAALFICRFGILRDQVDFPQGRQALADGKGEKSKARAVPGKVGRVFYQCDGDQA